MSPGKTISRLRESNNSEKLCLVQTCKRCLMILRMEIQYSEQGGMSDFSTFTLHKSEAFKQVAKIDSPKLRTLSNISSMSGGWCHLSAVSP